MDKVYNMCCSDNVDKIYKHHDKSWYGRHVGVCEKREYELTLWTTDPVNRRDERDGKMKREQRKSTTLDNFFSMSDERWRFT